MTDPAPSAPTPPPLPRKQVSDHAAWLTAFAAIKADPATPARSAALVSAAAQRLTDRLSHASRACYGWSGGKDSLALEIVCDAAGLTDALLVISGLEYPAFLAWATANMPWGLSVECRSSLNLGWLRAHRLLLFPTSSKHAARWFSLVQHTGQREFAARADLDLMVLGRRLADGNYCGKPTALSPTGGLEYLDRGGFSRFSPLADWSHEDVLTVLAAHHVDLPPCYGWPRGFRVGTGPWPARQWTASVEHGWSEVYVIDPGVVETAARADIHLAREAARRPSSYHHQMVAHHPADTIAPPSPSRVRAAAQGRYGSPSSVV